MTWNELLEPYEFLFDWMKSTVFVLGGIPFTFWELFVYQMLIGVLVFAIVKIRSQL